MLLFTGNQKITNKAGKTGLKKNAHGLAGQILSVFGFAVNRDIIFSNHKNIYRKKIEKRQRKLIVKISFLKFFLHSDETILLLTTGNAPVNLWEIILTFPAFIFMKKSLFVFTDKRIFHIPTSFRYAYRHAISQIRYKDCHKMAIRGKSLLLDLKNGERLVFSHIGSSELKKIKYLATVLPIKEGINPDTKIYALCPSCTTGLSDETQVCPICHLKFKSKYKAILRAMLIPGGGFFYSRHHVYGALMAGIESFALLLVALSGLRLHQNYSQINLLLFIFVAVVLIGVKSINGYHSGVMTEMPLPEKVTFKPRKI